MSDMALHMKTLEIEFSLYLPSLTDMQKAILKQTIIELYNQFGIFWETDIRQLKATDFPILSDLHALLEKKAEANKENPVYRDLAMLLYDCLLYTSGSPAEQRRGSSLPKTFTAPITSGCIFRRFGSRTEATPSIPM